MHLTDRFRTHALVPFLLAAGLLATAPAASAGVWSAGGGELIGYAHNPWFLPNTRQVEYCIRGDFTHISLARDQVAAKVRAALDYWRRQFQHASLPVVRGVKVSLADQEFVERPCTGTLAEAMARYDLVLQFGEISELQKSFLGDPTRYVAVTVMTDYDRQQLRGRGFVYVAADSGPLRYGKASLIDNAWSFDDGVLLEHILMHEFGHLFGLQHRGTMLVNNLMGAGFPEFILLGSTAPVLRRLGYPDVFVAPLVSDLGAKTGFCRLSATTHRFYGLHAADACLRHELVGDTLRTMARRNTGDADADVWRLVGTTALGPVEQEGREQLIAIGITEAQTVFPGVQPTLYDMGYLPGPSLRQYERRGRFISVDGKLDRFVKVLLRPGGLRIDGVLDGEPVSGVQ